MTTKPVDVNRLIKTADDVIDAFKHLAWVDNGDKHLKLQILREQIESLLSYAEQKIIDSKRAFPERESDDYDAGFSAAKEEDAAIIGSMNRGV